MSENIAIHDNEIDCKHHIVEGSRRQNKYGDGDENFWECARCGVQFHPLRDLMAQAEQFQTPAHRAAHAAIHLWSRRCDRYAKLHPEMSADSPEGRDAVVEILAEAIQHVFAPLIADEIADALSRVSL